jgi:hypothetical protein
VAGSKAVESSEYRDFVARSGFDYRRDLDSILAAFMDGDEFVLAEGRFDWEKLSAYAESSRGGCENAVCWLPAEKPGKRISFTQIRAGLLAMAVSSGRLESRAMVRGRRPPLSPPDQPVWISIPGAVLSKPETFPAGTQLFAKALQNSECVMVSMNREGGRFQARLDVTCKTAEDALLLEVQLERVTSILRKLIERSNRTPDPSDLSSVLVRGAFSRTDRKVYGYWPIERAFLEGLAGGAH